eukprot:113831-Prorocentrum_minimum.AAC.1
MQTPDCMLQLLKKSSKIWVTPPVSSLFSVARRGPRHKPTTSGGRGGHKASTAAVRSTTTSTFIIERRLHRPLRVAKLTLFFLLSIRATTETSTLFVTASTASSLDAP